MNLLQTERTPLYVGLDFKHLPSIKFHSFLFVTSNRKKLVAKGRNEK